MILRNLRIASGIPLKSFTNTRRIFTNIRLLDESNFDDKNDNPKTDAENNKEVVDKLNNLLKLMAKKEEPTELASKISVPKPRITARKKHQEAVEEKIARIEKLEKEKLGNQLAEAATKVAESLDGDPRETEKELLDIYFSRRQPSGEPDETVSSTVKKSVPLTELLSAMKVEKTEVSPELSRARQVRATAREDKPQQFLRKPAKSRKYERVDLFGEEPFGFFDAKKIEEKNFTPIKLSTWDLLYAREVKSALSQPPRNIFEQLIIWTEQGKTWRFPIDNEQDWHEEEKYDFTDHVFLERWLDPWCPETGPIRQFMQLVCTGLSKNPYLTVPEKQAHIFWYEHYFRSKKELLIDTGAGEIKDRPKAEEISN